MKLHPLVSIIVPIYNAADYLEATIKSVIAQSYSNWELILVDDGSTDNVYDIIKPFLNDGRIRYLSKKNTGVSDTRNVGVNASTGIYLCFLDADDIFLTNNIEEKVNFLNNNPGIPLVHGNTEIINENGLATGEYNEGKAGYILNTLLLWDGTNIPGPSSIMLKRDVFYEVGGWDTSFSTAADQDFFFSIAAKYPIGHINKVLTGYRVLPNSMSRNIAVMEKDHIAVYKKANKLKLFQSVLFKKRCFANLYLILAGSWWVNGHNKKRGAFFLFKAILSYPPIILKLTKKVLNKI